MINAARLYSSIAVLLLFVAPVDAQTSPAAEMNAIYAKVRETVAADKGKIPEEAINAKLRKIIAPMFDFEELTRQSLGAYWPKGTAVEQRQLVTVLSELLARTYIKRITRGVELIEVEQVREKVRGNKATVYADVSAKGVTISTFARLHHKNGRWRIFDVYIERIGLVNNYKNEFPGIVRKEGFRGLIDRLTAKLPAPS